MPEKIGKFDIVEKLGEGGMGVVYKAFDPFMERYVAVKTLAADLHLRPDVRARFLREARAGARVAHSNIITVHDLFEEDGRTYMVLEYLDGDNLDRAVQKGRVCSLEDKLWVITEVCEGLKHAHSMGIVHRDIKPANVFVTDLGQVKILDFGIARIANTTASNTNSKMGTPFYMSPEQWSGGALDHRTDIFSLGVMLYELVSGRKPFDSHNAAVIGYQVSNVEPPALRLSNPDLPEELEQIAFRALAKKPDDRYSEISELSDALASFRTVLLDRAQSMYREIEELRALPSPQPADQDPRLLDAVLRARGKAADQLTELPRLESPKSVPTGLGVSCGFVELQAARRMAREQKELVEALLPQVAEVQSTLRSAQELKQSGNLASANELVQGLMAAYPGLPPARELAQEIEEAASAAAHGSHDVDPDEVRILAEVRRLERKGESAEAIARLGQLLRVDPEHTLALQLKSRIETGKAKKERVRESAEEKADPKPDLPDVHPRELKGTNPLPETVLPRRRAPLPQPAPRNRLGITLVLGSIVVATLLGVFWVMSGSRVDVEPPPQLAQPDAGGTEGSGAPSDAGAATASQTTPRQVGDPSSVTLSVPQEPAPPDIQPEDSRDRGDTELDSSLEKTSSQESTPASDRTTRRPPAPVEPSDESPRPGGRREAAERAPEPDPPVVIVKPRATADVTRDSPPAPTTGTLNLQGPASTSVRVDQERSEPLPLKLELAPGNHQLEFVSPQGTTWTESVTIEAGGSLTMERDMSRLGSLSVTSEPWARVSVDDGEVRETPAFFSSVPAGRHRVRVSRDGFQTRVLAATVKEGETEVLAVQIERSPRQP